MKISKTHEAYTVQKPLLSIRIHGKILVINIDKMYFKEFKNWFSIQEKDELFMKNRFNFIRKLLYLYVITLV